MGDDFMYRGKYNLPEADPLLKSKLRVLVLLDVEDRVLHLGVSAAFAGVCITSADRMLANSIVIDVQNNDPREVRDELSFNICSMQHEATTRFRQARPGLQRTLLETVAAAVETPHGKRIFVDAPGGTGKTFCFNAILAHVRAKGDIALAVASSGIAALLLFKGRTAHSRLKLYIKPSAGQSLNVNIQARYHDATAELLKRTKIIVWDEVGPMHRFHLEVIIAKKNELKKARKQKTRD